jgi:hypothetical protein
MFFVEIFYAIFMDNLVSGTLELEKHRSRGLVLKLILKYDLFSTLQNQT